MTIKELLQNKINDGTICGKDLIIGRVMNFGKYKGKHILWLLSKHPFYMKWIIENTPFHLNDVEQWWKEEVETLKKGRTDDERIDEKTEGYGDEPHQYRRV